MKPYIFLDRDGTINKEKNYLYKVEDFEFEEGAVEGLRLLRQKGFGLVVVTNQSGIARGFYTREDVEHLHQYMCKQLEQQGVYIDGIYICPHEEKDCCNCRKPKTALYEQAIMELNIQRNGSYLVGDRLRDIIPAQELGMNFALLLTGYGCKEDLSNIDDKNVYENLYEFARSIAGQK